MKIAEPKGAKAEPKKEEAKKDAAVTVRVDADGLVQRIGVLPVPAANYRHLTSVGSRLYYGRGSTREQPAVYVFDLDKRKEAEVFAGGAAYEISADGKKMIVAANDQYSIVDAPTSVVTPSEHLDLSDLKVQLDRHAEWKQIFDESWRQMRDFFWTPNMNGIDWPAMKARYAPLVPYVNTRADLTYVIGEMIGELNSGHTYVGGGDEPAITRIPMGLLGAKLERDPKTKFFKIVKIMKGENWDPSVRSPLTEIGVNV